MYWHVFKLGAQSTMQYRTNFLVRAAFNLFPLVAVVAMWQAIFATKGVGVVAGYTLAQMVTYYVLVTVVEAVTAVAEDEWQMAADIREGQISQFLLRPIDYLHYRLFLFASGRVSYAVAAVLPVGLFAGYHGASLVGPASLEAVLVFGVALVLAAALQFLLAFLVAGLAFWVAEISTLAFILLAVERLASGVLFPLDILPGWAMSLLLWTPFAYEVYFPVSVYLGRWDVSSVGAGLGVQAVWVALLYGACRALWWRGVRTYSAVGG